MVAKLSDRIEGLPYNGVRVGDPVSLLENDVPYAKEGQLVNENLLINGGFDFWQRGTIFTSVNTGEYGADRWSLDEITNGTLQRVFAPENYEDSGVYIPQYYSNSASNNLIISNVLEYDTVKPMWGKTLTASCWVRCSVEDHPFNFVSQKSVTPNSNGNDWLGLGGGNFSSSTNPQKITFTFTVPVGVSAAGLRLAINVGNLVGNISFWGVKLELGSVATPYQARPIGEEEALCQRYYQTSYIKTVALTVYSPNGDTRGSEIRLPVTMRATPATSGSDVTADVIWVGSTSSTVNTPTCTFTPQNPHPNGYSLGVSNYAASSFGANPVINMGCILDTTFALDAEIY